jgi:hypothetical protein
MDIFAGKYKSDKNRLAPLSAVFHAGLGIVRWLIGFFRLTEEDRLKAGVYSGGEERDA